MLFHLNNSRSLSAILLAYLYCQSFVLFDIVWKRQPTDVLLANVDDDHMHTKGDFLKFNRFVGKILLSGIRGIRISTLIILANPTPKVCRIEVSASIGCLQLKRM